MDCKSETSSVDCSRGVTEDEEFGRFFEKLANLVPNVKYICEASSLDNENDGSEQHQQYDQVIENSNIPMSSNVVLNNDKNVSINLNKCINVNNDNITNSVQYIENFNDDTDKVSHNNSSFCYRKHSSKSCNVIKVCRNNRNRSAPYRVANGRADNSSSSSYDRQSRYKTNDASPVHIEKKNKLELLTDVIEYINNLKSLLHTAQRGNFNEPISSETNTRLCPEQRELHMLQQTTKSESFCRSTDKTDTTKQIRTMDRNFTLLEPRLSSSSDASVSFQISDKGPVDRAMELLEYKTGAITLTA